MPEPGSLLRTRHLGRRAAPPAHQTCAARTHKSQQNIDLGHSALSSWWSPSPARRGRRRPAALDYGQYALDGQRRVESLSAYARQRFCNRWTSPTSDLIEWPEPAISIEQKVPPATNPRRPTVGIVVTGDPRLPAPAVTPGAPARRICPSSDGQLAGRRRAWSFQMVIDAVPPPVGGTRIRRRPHRSGVKKRRVLPIGSPACGLQGMRAAP